MVKTIGVPAISGDLCNRRRAAGNQVPERLRVQSTAGKSATDPHESERFLHRLLALLLIDILDVIPVDRVKTHAANCIQKWIRNSVVSRERRD